MKRNICNVVIFGLVISLLISGINISIVKNVSAKSGTFANEEDWDIVIEVKNDINNDNKIDEGETFEVTLYHYNYETGDWEIYEDGISINYWYKQTKDGNWMGPKHMSTNPCTFTAEIILDTDYGSCLEHKIRIDDGSAESALTESFDVYNTRGCYISEIYPHDTKLYNDQPSGSVWVYEKDDIDVTVLDQNGRSLSGANIKIDGKKAQVISSSNGVYTVRTPEVTYDRQILVEAEKEDGGYLKLEDTFCGTVTVKNSYLEMVIEGNEDQNEPVYIEEFARFDVQVKHVYYGACNFATVEFNGQTKGTLIDGKPLIPFMAPQHNHEDDSANVYTITATKTNRLKGFSYDKCERTIIITDKPNYQMEIRGTIKRQDNGELIDGATITSNPNCIDDDGSVISGDNGWDVGSYKIHVLYNPGKGSEYIVNARITIENKLWSGNGKVKIESDEDLSEVGELRPEYYPCNIYIYEGSNGKSNAADAGMPLTVELPALESPTNIYDMIPKSLAEEGYSLVVNADGTYTLMQDGMPVVEGLADVDSVKTYLTEGTGGGSGGSGGSGSGSASFNVPNQIVNEGETLTVDLSKYVYNLNDLGCTFDQLAGPGSLSNSPNSGSGSTNYALFSGCTGFTGWISICPSGAFVGDNVKITSKIYFNGRSSQYVARLTIGSKQYHHTLQEDGVSGNPTYDYYDDWSQYHLFTSEGTYTITLEISSGSGYVLEDTKQITIYSSSGGGMPSGGFNNRYYHYEAPQVSGNKIETIKIKATLENGITYIDYFDITIKDNGPQLSLSSLDTDADSKTDEPTIEDPIPEAIDVSIRLDGTGSHVVGEEDDDESSDDNSGIIDDDTSDESVSNDEPDSGEETKDDTGGEDEDDGDNDVVSDDDIKPPIRPSSIEQDDEETQHPLLQMIKSFITKIFEIIGNIQEILGNTDEASGEILTQKSLTETKEIIPEEEPTGEAPSSLTTAYIEGVTPVWDFGDGTRGVGWKPVHNYHIVLEDLTPDDVLDDDAVSNDVGANDDGIKLSSIVLPGVEPEKDIIIDDPADVINDDDPTSSQDAIHNPLKITYHVKLYLVKDEMGLINEENVMYMDIIEDYFEVLSIDTTTITIDLSQSNSGNDDGSTIDMIEQPDIRLPNDLGDTIKLTIF